MPNTEDIIIKWDDEHSIKKILEAHIFHVKIEASRGALDLFSECARGLLDADHIDWFLTDLIALVGMEVEGKEMSVGILYFKNGVPTDITEKLHFARLGRWLHDEATGKERLVFGNKSFTEYRKIIRRIREELIGWISGKFLEPVLILTGEDKLPRVQDIRILSTKEGTSVTAHETYKEITRLWASSCFSIWVKPAATIRLYRNGDLFGQIMRLRDTGGWTTRYINRLVEIIRKISEEAEIPNISEATCRQRIIEPSIAMSESRKGCTIAIMEEGTFSQLESKWNNEGPEVACKALHAPIAEERRFPPTESEYENYLAQDGAVVISPDGTLLGMGTYFKGGPGGRKKTAAWLPKVVSKCMTIVTSQDGPTYLFWSVPTENGAREGKGVRLDFVPNNISKVIEVEP